MMNAEVSDGSIVLSQSADWRQQKIDQQTLWRVGTNCLVGWGGTAEKCLTSRRLVGWG